MCVLGFTPLGMCALLGQNAGEHLIREGFCRCSEPGELRRHHSTRVIQNPELFWSLGLCTRCSSTAEARPARAAPGSCQSTSVFHKGAALCCLRAESSWAKLRRFKQQLYPAHTAFTPVNCHWMIGASCKDQLNLSASLRIKDFTLKGRLQISSYFFLLPSLWQISNYFTSCILAHAFKLLFPQCPTLEVGRSKHLLFWFKAGNLIILILHNCTSCVVYCARTNKHTFQISPIFCERWEWLM